MLHIHHSNRLEALLERLMGVLAAPLADPMAPERVVVQHPGMGRWLAQELALRAGIAANLEFPLPGRALWDLLGHWIEDLPETSPWDRGPLTWHIFRLLGELASDPDLRLPALYLEGEPRELKAYQLARRVADLFDQYLIYRPDLIASWESGSKHPTRDQAASWQGRLWGELATGIDEGPRSRHRATLFQAMEGALTEGRPPLTPLPERLLLFGLSALPPVHARLLARIAGHLPVHLFVLSPCREYWADLVDEGRRARIRARELSRGAADGAALLDVGNPLLASWGGGGKAFQDLLIDLGAAESAHYLEPDPSRLLGLIQGDLLDLRDRRTPQPQDRTLLEATDGSLLIHACHSPQRELEVLHDRLLRLFEQIPGLRPREILVMAPDIDVYAPHIEAVFGAATEGDPRDIPYAIADRRLASEQPLLGAVESLLRLPESRLGAAEVVGWLDIPAIARRFGLAGEPLARVRQWVAESGVRWGLDGAMRARLGLPDEDANTWRFGLRRLFLGYALPSEGELFADVLPYPDLEGPETEALGGLQAFIDALARWRTDLPEPRPLRDWATAVNRMTADLLDPDQEEETLLLPLRHALDELRADAEAAGFEGPVGIDVLRAELGSRLDRTGQAQRFLTGRVTFCNMVPLRSIPARVLCLLGLNGREFPREQRPPAFDLMAAHPRPGDRSRREDDRQLFLEALLSARDCLHLSYLGRDQRDNGIKVPSVLVEELLAYIEGSFRLPDGLGVRDRLVIQHPLQPFSRRYFDGSEPQLYSYRQDWCQAARTRPEAGSDQFVPVPLGPASRTKVGTERETLEIEDLILFLRAPAAWFLHTVLGIARSEEETTLDESEPFVPNALEAWGLRQQLFRLAEQGREADAPGLLRASGLLPHGAGGELALEGALARVSNFRQRLAPHLEPPLEPVELDLEVAGARLVGWLPGLTAQGLVTQRLGSVRAVDRLGLWVRHLALNLAQPEGVRPHSVLVAEEETLELRPVASAADHLADLVTLFRKGRTEPLALFPETSLAFVLHGPGNRLTEAWEGRRNGRAGERDAWAVRTAFRGRDPLAPPFADLASRVFAPLLAATPEGNEAP
ncbi:MAG: exodeoxyribonuclease V subunit gamma [Chromatiaceae bacterium]